MAAVTYTTPEGQTMRHFLKRNEFRVYGTGILKYAVDGTVIYFKSQPYIEIKVLKPTDKNYAEAWINYLSMAYNDPDRVISAWQAQNIMSEIIMQAVDIKNNLTK